MDNPNLRSTFEQPSATPSQISALGLSLDELRENIQRLRDERSASLPANQLTFPQITELLESLPRLTEREILDLGHDSLCPICLNPLLAIFAEEEMAGVMDSPAHPIEELGVTILSQPWQCGHVFCRRDISKWIREAHDSCPMCRNLLVNTTASSGTPAVTDASLINPESPFEEIERQIDFHIDVLRRHLQDMPVMFLNGVHDEHISPSDEGSPDVRSTYSGMYS